MGSGTQRPSDWLARRRRVLGRWQAERCGRWRRRSASRASSTPSAPIRGTPLASASTRSGSSPSDLDVIAIGWDLPRLYPRFGGEWDFSSPARVHLATARLGLRRPRRPGVRLRPAPPRSRRVRLLRLGARVGCRPRERRKRRGRVDLDLRGQVRCARGPAGGVASLALARVHVRRGLSSARPDVSRGRQDDGLGRLRKDERTPWPLMEGDGAEFHPPFALGPEADYDDIIPAWEEQLGRLGSIPVGTPSANLDTRRARGADRLERAGGRGEHRAGARRARARDHRARCGLPGRRRGAQLLDQRAARRPGLRAAGLGGCRRRAWRRLGGRAAAAPLGPAQPVPRAPSVETPTSTPEGWTAAALEPAAVAERLLRGQVGAVAWGRAEVGPRALGHRSADRDARRGGDARPRQHDEGPRAVAPAGSDRHRGGGSAASGRGRGSCSATCSARRA